MQATPHLVFYLAASFCALVSIFFLVCFFLFQRIRSDLRLVSSEWKGLGGGLGGIRLSTSFIYLLLAIIFGLFMTIIVTRQIEADRQRAQNQFDLDKLRETETRKYEDAKQAREVDLEKARLAAKPVSSPPPAGNKPSGKPGEKN